MPIDTERREVALRLRECRDIREFAEALGFPWDVDSGWTWRDVTARLADFIDPGDMSQGRRDTVACDRDALLEQVEELEKCAWYFGLDFDEDEPLRDRLEEASEAFDECARRIREALGAES